MMKLTINGKQVEVSMDTTFQEIPQPITYRIEDSPFSVEDLKPLAVFEASEASIARALRGNGFWNGGGGDEEEYIQGIIRIKMDGKTTSLALKSGSREYLLRPQPRQRCRWTVWQNNEYRSDKPEPMPPKYIIKAIAKALNEKP